MSLNPQMGGRNSERVRDAVDTYQKVADKHGVGLTEMSLAWCLTRPFPCLPIFGATSQEQLEIAIKAADLTLSDEVLEDIDTAHRGCPMPY